MILSWVSFCAAATVSSAFLAWADNSASRSESCFAMLVPPCDFTIREDSNRHREGKLTKLQWRVDPVTEIKPVSVSESMLEGIVRSHASAGFQASEACYYRARIASPNSLG